MDPQNTAEESLAAAVEQFSTESRELEVLFDDALTISAESGQWSEWDAESLTMRVQQYGLEEITAEDVKNARLMLAGAAKVSFKRFMNFVDTVAGWIDKTGTKKTENLKRLLAEKEGDAHGNIFDGKIARLLSKGEHITTDLQSDIKDVIEYTNFFRNRVLEQLVGIAQTTTTLSKVSHVGDGHHVDFLLDRTVSKLAGIGSFHNLYPEKVLKASFLGGRTLFSKIDERDVPKEGNEKSTPELEKLRKIASEINYELDLKLASNGPKHPVNDRIPVLSRSDCEELIKSMEDLTDGMRLLAKASSGIKGLQPPRLLGKALNNIEAQANGFSPKAKAAKNMLSVVSQKDLLDYQKVIDGLWRLNTSVFDGCYLYIKTSIKHFS